MAAAEQPKPVLMPSQGSITLGNAFEYLLDPKGTLKLNDIKNRQDLWKKNKQATLFLGNIDDVVWVRFQIQNNSDAISNWILNIDWRFLDQSQMTIYNPQTDQWQVQNFFDADLPFAFDFTCPQNALRTIYLRVHSNEKLILPMRIWEENTYRNMVLYRNIFLGIALGILIAMLFYNTSLYFFTMDDSYSYYSVYVFSVLLYALAITGIGQTYIWPGNTWVLSHSYGIFSSFAFLMATIFIRKFLSLKEVGGWLLHLNTIVMSYWVLMILLFIFKNDRWLIDSEDIGIALSCLAGLVTAIILWARGNISAKYLTIAWILLILSTFVLMMGITGVIEYNSIVLHSQTAGFVLEMILLSIALAERINRERSDKETAQMLTVELHQQASEARARELKAQEKTLEVERAAKSELSQKVELRTKELSTALSKLETANEELSLLSRTDGLTKLFNRRYFDEMFEIEFKRALRLQFPMSVILGDIDRFKAINDTHGHQVGDECLKVVANIWGGQMARAGDMVARYGGEEFVAILSGTRLSDALDIAERIRHSIEAAGYTREGKHIPLTISLGVSSLELRRDGDSPAKLLERADEAMYTAKMQGRNKVASSRPFKTDTTSIS